MFSKPTFSPLVRCLNSASMTKIMTSNSSIRPFVRYQSSSSNPTSATQTSNKKKLTLIDQQKQIQQQQQQENARKAGSTAIESESKKKQKQKAKKGFNSLLKVPTTVKLKPKEVLLDNFFQAYKPLTLPLQPLSKKPSTIFYLEFDDNLELLNDGFADLQNGSPHRDDDIIIKDKNLARFEFSNYSSNKDLEVQSDYDNKTPSSPVKKATKKRVDDRFQVRSSKTGRTRVQYGSKKSKESDTNN